MSCLRVAAQSCLGVAKQLCFVFGVTISVPVTAFIFVSVRLRFIVFQVLLRLNVIWRVSACLRESFCLSVGLFYVSV